ncbi:MAG: MogA/MoaB family molybdenum cofactor biosynthesis protein [Deltaproteobacteria bacterium]|nr:MogA/MoaB family molybdenum cofactor biosynthesis protein [Deltaproteobacteria bacterium]MBW1960391.1 MogA/MoaB family molybdenum cofactor biosynthesis protein [Deltaproteobacteria bacterium]MBW1995242.1 MogA/MoaB family molybdenum cofactor biosynthesis protein [Deltaproteobacteria bacterium]MBW2151649.1 MogA/MoaB family molybdenum cofactor biosynthesis protein [Deltaproteobacteria bacterium]
MSHQTHRKEAPKTVKVGIITVSSSRTLQDDKSGQWINQQATTEGNQVVFHRVVPDDAPSINQSVFDAIGRHGPHVILLTGGTGISPKDVTIEAIRPMFSKELSAFGTLFTLLSFKQVDSAAILSRATAGVIGKTLVFCLPGSLAACQLACKELIFPELGHMVKHLLEA